MKTDSEIAEKQSERIFWVIQTVFGFILARSFYTYGTAFLPPLHEEIFTLTLALFSVYACVLWSWIDFSYTLIQSPYNFKMKPLERYRFVSDLFIVLVYTYLLLFVDVIKSNPKGDISAFLYAFTLVFFGYALSGVLRIIEYGRRASKIVLILSFLVVYIIIVKSYEVLLHKYPGQILNVVFIAIVIVTNGSYRVIRSIIAKRKYLIGIDVDGVIANQIDGLLPTIKEKHGIALKYEDVTAWRLPINDTSIDRLIVEEQKQRPYLMKMPTHKNASRIISKLIKKYKVAIATARPPESDEWTKQWLKNCSIPFDGYFNLREGGKQNANEDFDILIDDHIVNILAFLNGHKDKGAILFCQPWNAARSEIAHFEKENRLLCVHSWEEIPASIEKLLAYQAKREKK